MMEEGGIPWDLKLKNGSIKKVNLIPYVHVVIGDTKGHDANLHPNGQSSYWDERVSQRLYTEKHEPEVKTYYTYFNTVLQVTG